MRILITGSAGLVGRALANEYRDEDVVPLGHRELDVTDAVAVRRVVRDVRPDVIFNCAVIGVDDCEAKPGLARAINVSGPANLASAGRECGAAIVHFSTNYVFDGAPLDGRRPACQSPGVSPGDFGINERRGETPRRGQAGRLPSSELLGESTFYTIDDAPQPVNVYGSTKADGERAVVERCDRAFIIRTSWVFGQGKESFLATVGQRLKRGERVKAIRDIRASTTYVADLVGRVREIVAIGRPSTYHVVNSGVCSYEEFARDAARLVGTDEHLIEPVSESTLMRAPRPLYTPMRCLESERLGLAPLRHWSEALSDYLASLT